MVDLLELFQECERERTNYEKHLPPNTEEARKWLNTMNKDYHISWERLGMFLGVPFGSLSRFAKGGKLPHKYKKKLGIYYDRKLHDMPKRELRWALENRREL